MNGSRGSALAVLTLGALAACRGSASSSRSESEAAPSPPASSAVPAPPSVKRGCRVMALQGSATMRAPAADGGQKLARGDLVTERALLDLSAGAELTVQATVSGRELSVVGPATLEICPDGEEAIRLARGRVSAFPGAGVRPGAEVWIATPLGVVRFNEAKIEVEVSPDGNRLEVIVGTGHALFVAASGVRVGSDGGALDEALAPGSFRTDRPAVPLPQLVRELVRSCARRSADAEAAGRKVTAGGADNDAGLGERASAHVRERQRARAACESARAAGGLDPDILQGPLLVELAAAEAKSKQLTPLPARR